VIDGRLGGQVFGKLNFEVQSTAHERHGGSGSVADGCASKRPMCGEVAQDLLSRAADMKFEWLVRNVRRPKRLDAEDLFNLLLTAN
jgi:hypothetical protein